MFWGQRQIWCGDMAASASVSHRRPFDEISQYGDTRSFDMLNACIKDI